MSSISKHEMEKRRQKVLELAKQGKNQIQIAKELNVVSSTISNDEKALRKAGMLPGRYEEKNQRRQQVVELLKQGKTREEIAAELNVSITTVTTDVTNLVEKGMIDKRYVTRKPNNINKDINDLINEYYGQKRTLILFSQYIEDCKEKFKNGISLKKELETIKKVVLLTEKYEDIAFYARVSVRYRNFASIKQIINSQINNEELTKPQREKFLELKKAVDLTHKKYIAIDILKNNTQMSKEQRIEEAQRVTGLPEIELLQLNRKYNNKKIQKKDDNQPSK